MKMKEEICNDIKIQSVVESLLDELKQLLSKKYDIQLRLKSLGYDYDGIIIYSKGKFYSFLIKRLARINVNDSTIKVFDKKLYERLKEFGIENDFGTLLKCWDGADKE